MGGGGSWRMFTSDARNHHLKQGRCNSGGFRTRQRYHSEHLSPPSPHYELRLGSGLKTVRRRQEDRRGSGMRADAAGR
ncbi:hypothetical protein PBY51_021804 [Eleginops maclovinus]|uniref:Uncharacterized protein n=1 Tax=Eleginops maclovinus TaxID=56733 RepID=A0AAN7XDZ3_ELEMC|nr:hypothetical protein PBY51_021804 [Eleginops maclovinus]